jgi:hypothetical protein
MEAWIDFASGPLFRISLAVVVLGLLYRIGVIVGQIAKSWARANNKDIPVGKIALNTLKWTFPVRLFANRPIFSAASVLFHVGIILVPLFTIGHVAPLRPWLPGWWPALSPGLTEFLTLLAIVMLAVVMVARLGNQRSRELTYTSDVVLLVVLFCLMGSGYLAARPELNPVGGRGMLLAHMLLGNLALIITPMTKIAHCVLFPFSQLVFELGWHYPLYTGRRVAAALYKGQREPV